MFKVFSHNFERSQDTARSYEKPQAIFIFSTTTTILMMKMLSIGEKLGTAIRI